VGPNQHYLESSLNQFKTLFACTLFDWSWIWSFTHCSSILEFQVSLRFLFWEFRAFLTLCVHSGEHKVYLIINKTTLLIKIIFKKRHFLWWGKSGNPWCNWANAWDSRYEAWRVLSSSSSFFLFKKLNNLHFYFI